MGIKTVLKEQSGFVRDWATWRSALNDFAPRIFSQPAPNHCEDKEDYASGTRNGKE